MGGFTVLARTEDSTGYMITSTTAMGKVTKYRVDKLHDGSKKFTNTDANGLKTTTSDASDGAASTSTPDGTTVPTQQKPDPRFGMQSPLGNLTKTTPGGLTTNVNQFRTVTQMTGNAVTGVRDSVLLNGKIYKTDWDGNLRRLTKTSPEGRKTFSFYDSKAKIIKDSTAGIVATAYKYDSRGRRSEANQGGRRILFEYDSLGRQSRVTDPYGRVTQFFYDGADRLTRTVMPDGSEVNFSYDRNGNMTSLRPPGKPEHTFDYSPVDLETIYTPPFAGDSARATSRTYTLDKEASQVLRPDSLNITIQYDGTGSLAGLPKKVFFDRGVISNLYDTTKGLQIGVVSPTNDSLRYQYDGSLLKKITWSGNNGLNTVKGSVGFSYTSDQQVGTENIIPAVGNMDSVNYKYDKDGLMTSVGVMKLGYSSTIGLLTADTVSGVITNYTYTAFGELAGKETKYGATSLFKVDYVRDSLGRITQKTETIQGLTAKFNYAYDAVGRLSEVKRNDTTTAQYTYDQNGNRLAKVTPAGIDSGTYDSQDRMLRYGNATYVYSKYGDLQRKIVGTDTTRYVYDAFGSLVSVTMPNGDKIEYLLDGNGLRVGRKLNGRITNKRLYSNDLRIVAELDSADNIISRFVYTTSENVPEYVVKGGVTYRLVVDHLGCLRQVVNIGTGQVVEQIEYDEFGNVLADSNPGFVPFGFAGGVYDAQTNLVRFGARDYDAISGRWTAKDRIRFASNSLDLYSYVSCPLDQVDASGESAIDAVGDIVQAILALAEFDYRGAGASIDKAFEAGVATTPIPFSALGQYLTSIPAQTPLLGFA